MKNNRPIINDMLISLICGFLLGAALSYFSSGNFLNGWLGCGILSFLLTLAALRIWRSLGSKRTLAVLMIATFAVRMILGVFLFKILPVAGFDNPASLAGYVFSDASDRDQAAFQIASQGGLFAHDLAEFKAADQYGGLLATSALLYQVFSTDFHRPLLMVMISAFFMTVGVAFLFAAVSKKWGPKIALAASWLFALYPDGMLLGSSQMREPVLIGLTCLLFWVSLQWKEKPVRTAIIGVLITAVTCLFSTPVAAAEAAVVAGIVFVEWFADQQNSKTKSIGISIFVLFLGLAIIGGWMWLKGGLSYEFYVTQAASGWIDTLVKQFGEKLAVPFLSFYGLTQPLLPAALVDSTKPIWKFIAIFRASGWYILLPFVVYAVFASVKAKKEKQRNLLLFIAVMFFAWTLISSVRGGGDQWDNPRYRTTFLPWMAILFGWVWMKLREQKCPWFWRIVAIESVFVLIFLNWYLYRYLTIGIQIPFIMMIALIAGLSGIIVLVGFMWDKIKKPAKSAG